jgi:soluble lytic murein transglycosylase-like protein
MADYYFRDTDDDDAGEHTQMVRRAFRLQQKTDQRRHRRRTTGMLAVAGFLLVLLAVAVGTIVWQHQKVSQARALAVDLFYDIKTMEIHLAQVEERVRRTQETRLIGEMEANRAKLREMARRYQQYVDEMETKGPTMSEEDLAILRVARIFGECDLNMPDAFKDEVKAYIAKWKSSGRLERAIRTLQDRGYVDIIHDAMREQDLPSQFLYLGLQESNFNAGAIGPETAYGIAKGAWQFIPGTAERFGLRVGPLKDVREYDPLDQRFDFAAATRAAARYLRSIYNTDAQASGLLVMASYNWGEGNIIKRIRTMPENPRQRNFWELVNSYKIPDETYGYVLHIVAAAVIGENPALFGFDFENPLEGRDTGDVVGVTAPGAM